MNICPQNSSLKSSLKGSVAQPTFLAVGASYQEFHKYSLMSSPEQILGVGIIFPIGQVPTFFSLTLLEIELTDLDSGTFLLIYL